MSPPATALTMPDFVTSPSACGRVGLPATRPCRMHNWTRGGTDADVAWRLWTCAARPLGPIEEVASKSEGGCFSGALVYVKRFPVLPNPAANAMYETRGGISMKQAGHSPAARSSEVEKRISPAKIFPRPGLGRPRPQPLARPLARPPAAHLRPCPACADPPLSIHIQ